MFHACKVELKNLKTRNDNPSAASVRNTFTEHIKLFGNTALFYYFIKLSITNSDFSDMLVVLNRSLSCFSFFQFTKSAL